MKKILSTAAILFIITGFAFSQSQDHSYVKTITYLEEDTTKKVTSVSYFDAFGRPLQSVVSDASPSGNDIVQTYQYDELGRVSKSYLPFTNDGTDLQFLNDALNLQTSFYSTSFPNQNAYSEAEYDNSPYNRIIKQSTPGEDINSVNITSDYELAGPTIDFWYIDGTGNLIRDEFYSENELMKFTIKNADDKQSFVYKDKTGKVVLKEIFDTGFKTRCVYDQYGRLRYVLSPEAVNRMTAVTYDMNSDLVKKYCYYYEYNEKHQLISKQLPGKEPVYLRYDSQYQLRMTQDGKQRLVDKWMFINYDYLGRTVSTGLGFIDTTEIIQDTIMPPAEKGITAFLTYQYYDNYDFIEDVNLQFDASLAYHDKFDRIRGKTTGSKVRVMRTDVEEWLTSVVYYDKYGRVIQAISKNYVGGYDIVSNEYDFAGKLLETKHKHTAEKKDPKILIYLYDYDDMGRLLKVKLKQNEFEPPLIINEITYNELGQVEEKKIHSENGTAFLQTVNYGYNIKGAITNINDPKSLGDDLFGMSLHYDDEITVSDISNTPYEDGKISAIQWNSQNLNQVQTYMYEYDDLNRLTQATYAPGNKYDVNIDYDLNGNITGLERKGEVITKYLSQDKSISGPPPEIKTYEIIDDLTYTYNGNQLTTVSDAIGEIETQLNNDFRDVSSKIGFNEYYYDANGNMTKDLNKGINLVIYNHLNQPTEVQKSADDKTVYVYTATGLKLKTEIYEAGKLKTATEYSGAYVYENDNLSFINIPGGRIVAKINEYQYNLTDHLGNVRVTFKDSSGTAKIIQEDHYYPFGMRMSGQHYSNTDLINKYLYNGKELQDQTNYYSYGFREYDPQLGRWHVIDAMAEKYISSSPYHFAGNNPISNREINGMEYLLDPDYGAGEGDVSLGGGAQWVNYRGATSFYGDNSGNYSVGGGGSTGGGSYEYHDGEYYNSMGEVVSFEEAIAWAAINADLFLSINLGSTIYIDVFADFEGLDNLMNEAVNLINDTYEGLNVNLSAEWHQIGSLDEIKGKNEFYGRDGANVNDSYVVATTTENIKDVFVVMTGRGWSFGDNYVEYDDGQVQRHLGDNGFSFHDKAAIINLDNAKKRYNGANNWFDSGSQKLGMTIMHETGHPKFMGHHRNRPNPGYPVCNYRMGHVSGTIMDGNFMSHHEHDTYMIGVLQFLHGKIYP